MEYLHTKVLMEELKVEVMVSRDQSVPFLAQLPKPKNRAVRIL